MSRRRPRSDGGAVLGDASAPAAVANRGVEQTTAGASASEVPGASESAASHAGQLTVTVVIANRRTWS
jgi:hypothetical protein